MLLTISVIIAVIIGLVILFNLKFVFELAAILLIGLWWCGSHMMEVLWFLVTLPFRIIWWIVCIPFRVFRFVFYQATGLYLRVSDIGFFYRDGDVSVRIAKVLTTAAVIGFIVALVHHVTHR
jgi:hypothetical protein